MSEHVYKKTEIVGSSKTSIDDAIQRAIGKASETIKNIDWFEVGEVRGLEIFGRVGFGEALGTVAKRFCAAQ